MSANCQIYVANCNDENLLNSMIGHFFDVYNYFMSNTSRNGLFYEDKILPNYLYQIKKLFPRIQIS